MLIDYCFCGELLFLIIHHFSFWGIHFDFSMSPFNTSSKHSFPSLLFVRMFDIGGSIYFKILKNL